MRFSLPIHFLKKIQSCKMHRHLARLLCISVACLLFTAISNANLGIISQFASQHGNDWIGPVSIALIFLGSGLGALYNGYIGRYPFSRVIFTGAVGWDIFCGFSVMFLYIGFQNYINAIIIVGSFGCGFIVSIYYNGVFNFVNECGNRDKKTKTYFGINLCFNQSSNIVGNACSALMIKPLGQKIYSFVMLGAGIMVSLIFLLLKEFDQSETLILQHNTSSSLISEGGELDAGQTKSSHIIQERKIEKIPILLIFPFAFSGVLISFVFGQFSILFYKYYGNMDKEMLNQLTFRTFMVEGCGQFIGGLLLAVFAKKITNFPLTYILNGLVFMASLILINFGLENDDKNVLYGGAFFLGVADCFCFSITLTMAGKWQQDGLSLFNLGQSGTVAILSILHIFIDLEYLSLIYVTIFIASSLILYLYRHSISQIHQEHY